MFTFSAIAIVVSALLGFAGGRVHHPANLKVAAIKAEIAKIETEVKAYVIASAIVVRLKKLL
jgi:hypothetical protein